uniref:MULE transposase domain-containing protein n=1 Tax=Pygocentrus nattereri TaxID=42514 RepID=A0AAR2LVR7_PYGNA
MVDKDLKEINAVRNIFPHAKVLLCWFHVLQVILVINIIFVKPVLELFGRLIHIFMWLSRQFIDGCYGREDTCAEMWADFGRRVFHQNSETNNQLERLAA